MNKKTYRKCTLRLVENGHVDLQKMNIKTQ